MPPASSALQGSLRTAPALCPTAARPVTHAWNSKPRASAAASPACNIYSAPPCSALTGAIGSAQGERGSALLEAAVFPNGTAVPGAQEPGGAGVPGLYGLFWQLRGGAAPLHRCLRFCACEPGCFSLHLQAGCRGSCVSDSSQPYPAHACRQRYAAAHA
jgi:hypothetical protein